MTAPATTKPKLASAVTVKLSPALHDAACRLALAEYDGNVSGMIRALIKAAVLMQASAR